MGTVDEYDNTFVKEFPYDALAAKMSWFPAYLESLTPRKAVRENQAYLYNIFMDVLLVMTGCRTSALHFYYRAFITKIINHINKILISVGAHEYQLRVISRINQDGSTYFITNKRNRKFIWNTQLTHFEIGKNLDYFASGHWCGSTEISPKITSMMVEVSSSRMIDVVTEIVDLDYCDEEDVEQMSDYYLRKEKLFNITMVRLRLPYRFKWVLDTKFQKDEEIGEVMGLSEPPSLEWWDANYCFVNGLRRGRHLLFCDGKSNIKEYWPIIQSMYTWINTLPKYPASRTQLWTKIDHFLTKFRDLISHESNLNSSIIVAEMTSLIEIFEKESLTIPQRVEPAPQYELGQRRWNVLRLKLEELWIKRFEKWKLTSLQREFGMKRQPVEANGIYICSTTENGNTYRGRWRPRVSLPSTTMLD